MQPERHASDVAILTEERRSEIVWLLTHRNDHLPLPVRHVEGASGFVNERRPRSCPDCLANGRTMVGCETCGGSGVVEPSRIGLVSAADEFGDDGEQRDPYSVHDKPVPSFSLDRTRHDESHARDRQIEILKQQTRPPQPEADLLEEANRRGYAWEEERRTMYRRFDFAEIDRALDMLRAGDIDAAHAINAVYVDGWMADVGYITVTAEALCERGLRFLDAILPAELRTALAPKHPALIRRERKRAA